MIMAYSLLLVILICFMLPTIRSECTKEELDRIFDCFQDYNSKFYVAIGTMPPCNYSLITDDLCSDFDKIVRCTNSQDVSDDKCRPVAENEVSSKMDISCKVSDFVEVCTNATAIKKGIPASDSCQGATISLLLMSLLTTFASGVVSHSGL